MTVLLWQTGTTPLMLAPMQGLTNRALRAYFIEHVRPDVIDTTLLFMLLMMMFSFRSQVSSACCFS